jgi:hypothetical protein
MHKNVNFQFHEFTVVMDENNNPWFIAHEVLIHQVSQPAILPIKFQQSLLVFITLHITSRYAFSS